MGLPSKEQQGGLGPGVLPLLIIPHCVGLRQEDWEINQGQPGLHKETLLEKRTAWRD